MRISEALRGKRALVREVGIIVLGVLLALGAQEAVKAWQVREDVAALRQTIDQEIGYNLYALDRRGKQIACDQRKLAELDEWLVRSRTGSAMPPLYSYPSRLIAAFRGAWNSRDTETYRQLPADVRIGYSRFYDGFDNNRRSWDTQNDGWRSLRQFLEPGPLTLQERREARMIHENILRAVRVDGSNIASLFARAKEMGLRVIEPPGLDPVLSREALQCRSILEPPQP